MPQQQPKTDSTLLKTGFGLMDVLARLQALCLRQASRSENVDLAFFSQHALRDIGITGPLNDNRSVTSYDSPSRHRIISNGITGL